MTREIKPQGDRVVVLCHRAQASQGGILLPDSAQKKLKQGKIIAVGPGIHDAQGNLRPVSLKVGDEVYYSSYSGTEIELDQQEYLIISENDVFGVIES